VPYRFDLSAQEQTVCILSKLNTSIAVMNHQIILPPFPESKSTNADIGPLFTEICGSLSWVAGSGIPTNFFSGEVQQIQLRTEDRERGSGGGSPLVRGSGGSCNLVQEISFHIVKFS
jgi:hypothetical protein